MGFWLEEGFKKPLLGWPHSYMYVQYNMACYTLLDMNINYLSLPS